MGKHITKRQQRKRLHAGVKAKGHHFSVQVAQLSQRPRDALAFIYVVEYFAVTQDHSRSFEMTPLSPY